MTCPSGLTFSPENVVVSPSGNPKISVTKSTLESGFRYTDVTCGVDLKLLRSK